MERRHPIAAWVSAVVLVLLTGFLPSQAAAAVATIHVSGPAPAAGHTHQGPSVAPAPVLPAAFTFHMVNELGQPMAGTLFALFVCDPEVADTCDPVDAWLVTSGEGGLVWFEAGTGRYLLVEKETQPGYELPKGGWLVTVDTASDTPVTITSAPKDPLSPPPAFRVQADGSLVLPNYRQVEIPLLGGGGVLPWLAGGVALIGLGVLYVLSTTSGLAKPFLSVVQRGEK